MRTLERQCGLKGVGSVEKRSRSQVIGDWMSSDILKHPREVGSLIESVRGLDLKVMSEVLN